MPSFQDEIAKMHRLLDELIKVAQQLKEFSLQTASRESIETLQAKQKELISQIQEVDQILKNDYEGQTTVDIQEKLQDKLRQFELLNEEFIKNIKANRGLIEFDLYHKEKNKEDLVSE